MDPQFERRWRNARALENAGEVSGAKDIYEEFIAEDPARVYVRLRLSAIERVAGNYRNAHAHITHCVESVRNGRWKDLAAVTRGLLMFDEWRLVGELIKGTDWSHPEVIRSSPVLSQHLWLIGEVPDALRLIDAALPWGASSPSLRYSRALSLP